MSASRSMIPSSMIENAVECVVEPACSKLKMITPIVSVPLDHNSEETVNSVSVVSITRNAPLIIPEKSNGTKIDFHLTNVPAPNRWAASSKSTDT